MQMTLVPLELEWFQCHSSVITVWFSVLYFHFALTLLLPHTLHPDNLLIINIYIQSNLDTTYLGITYFLLLHTFLPSPVFSPSLSLLIYPQYNVHFTTYNLLQRSFSGRPKFVFSYMFQPRYNVYRKTAISCQIWSKNHSRDQPHI